MTDTIRIALAGAGAFGIKHLDGLQLIDGVEVTSLVGRELAKTWAQDEATLHVARYKAVVLQGDSETMSGRPGQPGGADELRQGGGSGFQGAQNDRRLVKNADSARVVHALILPSQTLRRKFIASESARVSETGPQDAFRTRSVRYDEGAGHGRHVGREGLGCAPGSARRR